MLPANLAETVVSNPEASSVLAVVITALLWRARRVPPARVAVYDRFRRAVARLLHRPFNRFLSFPLLRSKTGAKDEYIATVDAGRDELMAVLWDCGFRWNPISRVKYRTLDDDRRQYALSLSHVESITSPWQQDIHIFPNPDGSGYDILGHWEPAPTNPEKHLGGEHQDGGDPERVVRDALDEAGVSY